MGTDTCCPLPCLRPLAQPKNQKPPFKVPDTPAAVGHLRPLMSQKTRVGNDRSQSTTDVARRRNRNEKLYKAGARSSVTLAAKNADRRAAVSEIELALSTHTRRWRFSGPVTDVLCKLPFAEFFEKNRIRCKRSLPDFHQRCEQDCSRPAAFKNATVRERPTPAGRRSQEQPFNIGFSRAAQRCANAW